MDQGQTFTISNSYNDDGKGYVAGTVIPEDKLKLFKLDTDGRWKVVNSSMVDIVNNVVYADLDEFGTYAIMGYYGSEEFDDSVFAYPNPVKGDNRVTIEFNLNSPAMVSVKIYTIIGELVNDLGSKMFGRGFQHRRYWDGKNGIGRRVVNGVYLMRIEMRDTIPGITREVILQQAIIK